MSSSQCPGQNRRFWKPKDIFDAECSHCGSPLEFWRDDVRRACPSCGQTVINPKVDLACAQWCQFAEQCLEGLTLEDQLVAAVKGALEEQRAGHALRVLEYAKHILESEEADARAVIAAVLLHDLDPPSAATEILGRLGVEGETIDRISAILARYRHPNAEDPREFYVVHDADALQHWMESGPPELTPKTERRINEAFRTPAGRRLAKTVFLRAASSHQA